MKRAFILAGVLTMLLLVVSCGKENAVEATSADTPKLAVTQGSAQSYSDYQGVVAPPISNVTFSETPITAKVQGNLSVYSTRSSFQLALSCDRTSTGFEGSKLPLSSVGVVLGALNSDTDDANYSSGAIADGITLNALYPEQIAVLTKGFLGVHSTVVGPNFFSADLLMQFPPQNVNAVSMELLGVFGPTTMDIYILAGGNNILGVFTVTSGTTTGNFFGVLSPVVPIRRILIHQLDTVGGELVDNVGFGSCELN